VRRESDQLQLESPPQTKPGSRMVSGVSPSCKHQIFYEQFDHGDEEYRQVAICKSDVLQTHL
jgi:hypothetical protein